MQYQSNNAIDNSPSSLLIVVVTIIGIIAIKFILNYLKEI